jgi:hypothetical protein
VRDCRAGKGARARGRNEQRELGPVEGIKLQQARAFTIAPRAAAVAVGACAGGGARPLTTAQHCI